MTAGEVRHMQKNSSSLRESNLELFRIVTMFFIVAHHYVVNSGLTLPGGPVFSDPFSWRSVFLLLFGAWGKTGINCFVLITGYFMCKSQITGKKFLKLLFEIEFYSLGIWLVFVLSGYEKFSFSGLLSTVVPFTHIESNFTGCFLLFYLLIPFLNILISHLSEKQHVMLLGLCLFIFTLIDSVPTFQVGINYVIWFSVLYILASYIRLYPKAIYEKTSLWGLALLVSVLAAIGSILFMTWFGVRNGNANIVLSYFFVADSNRILAVLVSVCAFLFFKSIKLRYSPFINMVAASVFGVLLIHANNDAMRRWLWGDLLRNVTVYNSPYLILHAIGSVAAIYIICTLIDLIRIRLLERPVFALHDKRS